MNILFVDTSCPKSYSPESLTLSGLGGTEATVIRVAEGLGALGHNVSVYQHCRAENTSSEHAEYIGRGVVKVTPDVVITLRKPEHAADVYRLFPKAKHILWLHDWAQGALSEHSIRLSMQGITVVCVSDTHKVHTEAYLKQEGALRFPVTYIYNPVVIPPLLERFKAAYSDTTLVFFSSPHKGYTRALELFNELQRRTGDLFTLYVANPGYYKDEAYTAAGVVNLGPRSHKQVLSLVGSALAVFYPNTVFPETFGLVFAEANALGTPVLTHDLGAAREVLDNADAQLVDCTDDEAVIEKLLLWRENRPKVFLKEAYTLPNVIKEWDTLITHDRLS